VNSQTPNMVERPLRFMKAPWERLASSVLCGRKYGQSFEMQSAGGDAATLLRTLRNDCVQ
jgi:hypothetical protein